MISSSLGGVILVLGLLLDDDVSVGDIFLLLSLLWGGVIRFATSVLCGLGASSSI